MKPTVFRALVITCGTALGLGANSAATAECFNTNTCFGVSALPNNSGERNTAIGYQTLFLSDRGRDNTATGYAALQNSTFGQFNTAFGSQALRGASGGGGGGNNTAIGYRALQRNSTGANNTAAGIDALLNNTSGFYNTAVGNNALRSTTSGSLNVALGHRAGEQFVTGNYNIHIGADNRGDIADTGVIRLGSPSKINKTFIGGIRGIQTGLSGAVAVLIDGRGQLGTIQSSRAVKQDILPMGDVSDRLLALRPVTFRYQKADSDGSKPIQFGLIAEEVAESFPELVVYDANGKPESVSYHLLATLLLNEFQEQAARMTVLEAQAAELALLKKEFAQMVEAIEQLDHSKMVASTQ